MTNDPTKHSDVDARSRLMARVRGKDTKPEMIVRRMVHAMGYRFRLHGRELPGSPDLVFPARKAVIFVHGCFWHRHVGCRRASMPKTRQDFWRAKFIRNVARDQRNEDALTEAGWRSAIIWECEAKDIQRLKDRLYHFLEEE